MYVRVISAILYHVHLKGKTNIIYLYSNTPLELTPPDHNTPLGLTA